MLIRKNHDDYLIDIFTLIEQKQVLLDPKDISLILRVAKFPAVKKNAIKRQLLSQAFGNLEKLLIKRKEILESTPALESSNKENQSAFETFTVLSESSEMELERIFFDIAKECAAFTMKPVNRKKLVEMVIEYGGDTPLLVNRYGLFDLRALNLNSDLERNERKERRAEKRRLYKEKMAQLAAEQTQENSSESSESAESSGVSEVSESSEPHESTHFSESSGKTESDKPLESSKPWKSPKSSEFQESSEFKTKTDTSEAASNSEKNC